MKPGGIALPILVTVLVAGGYVLLDASDRAAGLAAKSSDTVSRAATAKATNRQASVGLISPAPARKPSVMSAKPAAPNASRRYGPQPGSSALQASMLRHRYETAHDYRTLFDELQASSAAEAPFFAARILHRCFEVGEHGLEAAVRHFSETIGADMQGAQPRIAAFRQMKEPCIRFAGRVGEPNETDRLLAEGTRRGDLRAASAAPMLGRLEVIEAELEKRGAQMLESADPYVLLNVVNLLSINTSGALTIDGEPVGAPDRDAAHLAWDLVACDYGRACGPDSEALLSACAYEGHCRAETLEDLVRVEYASGPKFGRIQLFRERILAALARKDFASLGVPVPN